MVSESKKDKTLADRYQAAQPQAEDKLYMVNDRDGLYVTVLLPVLSHSVTTTDQ